MNRTAAVVARYRQDLLEMIDQERNCSTIDCMDATASFRRWERFTDSASALVSDLDDLGGVHPDVEDLVDTTRAAGGRIEERFDTLKRCVAQSEGTLYPDCDDQVSSFLTALDDLKPELDAWEAHI